MTTYILNKISKKSVMDNYNTPAIENFKLDENEQHISHAGVAQLVRARGS